MISKASHKSYFSFYFSFLDYLLGKSQLSFQEDTQVSLWRGSHSEKLRPSTNKGHRLNSHMSEPPRSRFSSYSHALRKLQPWPISIWIPWGPRGRTIQLRHSWTHGHININYIVLICGRKVWEVSLYWTSVILPVQHFFFWWKNILTPLGNYLHGLDRARPLPWPQLARWARPDQWNSSRGLC